MNIPKVYLLCGLPGSGKTTYAKQLEKDGVVRLSLDEELFKLFGREFPSDQYGDFEKKTKEKLLDEVSLLLEDKRSVSLDWGFWKKNERNRVRSLLEGRAEVKLLYFKRDTAELADRVANRDLSTNHEIGPQMLEDFTTQFEQPVGENEEIIKETYIKCKKCGAEIHQNTHKKMISCNCGAISVDGSDGYVRMLGSKEDYDVIQK
jgi:predicted kinase